MYGEGYWPRKILRIPLKFSYRNSLSNLLYGEGYWTRKILKIPSNLSYRNSLSSLINIALHITVALFIQCFLFRRPINGTLAVRPDYTQGHENSCGEEKKTDVRRTGPALRALSYGPNHTGPAVRA